MAANPGWHRNLSNWLRERSIRQLLISYVVGGWAALEVLTTIAELTGLPPSLPRLAGLILIVGLFVTLAVALVQRALSGIGKAGVDRRFGPGRRVLIGLMIFFALIPMSFYADDETIRWIMWRNAPVIAGIATALALLTGIGWWLSSKTTEPDEAART